MLSPSAQIERSADRSSLPGVLSQVAFIEGNLEEAGTLAASTLAAARRLHFERHYFVFHALRTAALLALEQRDLDAAAEPVERALGIVGSARPAFNYLAQLDRARIWAAGGNLDAALASLPAACSALKSDHSVLLAEADEFEVHLRLGLGDQKGAAAAAERLPGDRRIIISATIALAAGNPEEAAQALSGAPAEGATIRSDLELRLLRAEHRGQPILTPGTCPGPAGPGHGRAPRFHPDRRGYGSEGSRARDLQFPPLSPDQAAEGTDHRRS